MSHCALIGSPLQAGNPGLTVVIQGQGQTQGQLQILPQGVTVIPAPGQQLMQAAMPNGDVQRFLFTPMAPGAAAPPPAPAPPPPPLNEVGERRWRTCERFKFNQAVSGETPDLWLHPLSPSRWERESGTASQWASEPRLPAEQSPSLSLSLSLRAGVYPAGPRAPGPEPRAGRCVCVGGRYGGR